MNQKVKDFLKDSNGKIVQPYIASYGGEDVLVLLEDSAPVDTKCFIMLCKSKNIWVFKSSLIISSATIQPKSRSIEDGLVEGDIIVDKDNIEVKVLMANQHCVIISRDNDFDRTFGTIFTYSELIEQGYKLKQ